jgi:hypothetical protein
MKDFPKTVHTSKTKLPKNVKQPDSYEVDFLLYGSISALKHVFWMKIDVFFILALISISHCSI